MSVDKGADGLDHIRAFEKMLQVIPANEKLVINQQQDAQGNIIYPSEKAGGPARPARKLP